MFIFLVIEVMFIQIQIHIVYIKIINDENQSKRLVLVLTLKKENLNRVLNAPLKNKI